MYTSIGLHPKAADVAAVMFDGTGRRIRIIEFGEGSVALHVHGLDVLDALVAALDEIRADMDATTESEARVLDGNR